MDRAATRVLLAGLAGLLPWACEREQPGLPRPAEAGAPGEQSVRNPPVAPPAYEFARGLRRQHPQVCAFLREFLATCLAGQYEDYRKLVSRSAEPESRERFEAICRAIRAVRVERIEPVRVAGRAAYRVVSSVVFRPGQRAALRAGSDRDIAILVFEEEGQWRMMPAPAELQPAATRPATSSAPTATAPHYPWDQQGDY